MTEKEGARLRRYRPAVRRRCLYELSHLERTSPKARVGQGRPRVDLVIKTGEMVSLEGPSGRAKTTLLQLLGALDSRPAARSASRVATWAGSATGAHEDRQRRSVSSSSTSTHPDLTPRRTRNRNVPEPRRSMSVERAKNF